MHGTRLYLIVPDVFHVNTVCHMSTYFRTFHRVVSCSFCYWDGKERVLHLVGLCLDKWNVEWYYS